MNITERKQKIKELIEGSMFLETGLKDRLVQNLDRANEKDLDEIESLFTDASRKQGELLDKMVTHDDTFVPRLQAFKRTQIRGYQKKEEQKERTEENPEEILKNI